MQELLDMLKQEGYVPSQKFLDFFKEECNKFHVMGYGAGYQDAKQHIAGFLEEITTKLRETND